MGLINGLTQGLTQGLNNGLNDGVNQGVFNGLISDPMAPVFKLSKKTLRCWYHLEDLTDSSGNGKTLTNYLSNVSFNPARFYNGADYGTVQPNKSITLSSNPLTSTYVPNITKSFWFKLNDTSNTTGFRLSELNTVLLGGSGSISLWTLYVISAGVLKIYSYLAPNGNSGFQQPTIGTANTTTWYHVVTTKTPNKLTTYVNGVAVGQWNYQQESSAGVGSPFNLTIGSRDLVDSLQAKAIFDEYILDEKAWSDKDVWLYYSNMIQGRMPILI